MDTIPQSFDWVTHPIVAAIVINTALYLALGFVPPRLHLQLPVLVFFSSYAISALYAFSRHIQTTSWLGCAIGGALWTPPVLYWDRAILRGLSWKNRKAIFKVPKEKRNKVDTEDTFKSRYNFGSNVVNSIRGLGTTFEVKYVPQWSATDSKYIPSPTSFVATRLITILLCIYLNSWCIKTRARVDQTLVQQSKIPFFTRINEITIDDVQTRFTIGLIQWVQGYCILQFLFGIPGLIIVLLNPSELQNMRPDFGPVSEAYTLRGWWG